MIKFIERLLILLFTVLFLSSCSLNNLLDPYNKSIYPDDVDSSNKDNDFEDDSQAVVNIIDDMEIAEDYDDFNYDEKPHQENSDNIELTVNAPISGNDHTDNNHTDNNSTSQSVQMEIKLFFADKALVEESKPGEYGYVTPVLRKVPATSGILKVALNELIKGPLPEEQNLGPAMPTSLVVNKVAIENKVAVIDFNKALITDHSGGTLGGTLTMQAIVFTAAQFDSVDGVLVTVDGQPWDDGHFIWDTPIYEEDLLKSFQNS